jgi:hypothetical protein
MTTATTTLAGTYAIDPTHSRIGADRHAGLRPIDVVQPSTFLSQIAAEEVVVLAVGTAWQIPWELLMLGPFTECVLDDGGQMRHVTAGALLSSAARRSSPPSSPLEADDYCPLPKFASDMTLLDAARLIVETGWDHAIVMDPHPRLIAPRSVLRSILEPYISPNPHQRNR